jgi:transposase-like protein
VPAGDSGDVAQWKRREFTAELKAETLKLIRETDRSVGEICRELNPRKRRFAIG